MADHTERGFGDIEWNRVGPYEFVHPSGWTITNRIIRRRPVWTLRYGYRSEGSFPSPAAAMARHGALIGLPSFVQDEEPCCGHFIRGNPQRTEGGHHTPKSESARSHVWRHLVTKVRKNGDWS
jgi:hypothetical protein